VKLRQLPEDHPYLEEELFHIMSTVYDHREDRTGGGMLSQWKELGNSGNRRRIFIGVAIFVFMQFAGSNAIK